MKLKILDFNYNPIAYINDYINPIITHKLEYGDKELTFTLPLESEDIDKLKEQYFIEYQGHRFCVKQIVNDINILCQLDIEDLQGTVIEEIIGVNDTITELLTKFDNKSGWTFEVVNFTKRRTINMIRCSVWELIKEIIKTYTCEIKIDSINRIVYFSEEFGEDLGVYFAEGLNLDDYSITSDTYNLYTRIIPLGVGDLDISSVNDGKRYIDNFQFSDKIKTFYWKDERYTDQEQLKADAEIRLKALSKPNLSIELNVRDLAALSNDYYKFKVGIGDYVIALIKGNKQRHRVIEYIENITNPFENIITLSNVSANLSSYLQEQQNNLNNLEVSYEKIKAENGEISLKVQKVEYDLEEKATNIQFTELKQEFDNFELKTSTSGGSNFIIEGNKEHYFDLRSDNSLQKKPLEVDSKFIKSIKGQKITLSLDVMGWQNNLQDNIFTGFELEVTYTDSAKSWHNVTVENASYIKHQLNGGEYQRYASHSNIENKDISSINLNYFIRGFTGEVKVKNACITLGHTIGSYIQHETSLVEGITRIDLNGVTVEHSETNTKTNLNSESLSILDKYSNKELAYFGRGNKAYIDTLETNRVISDSVIPLVSDKGNVTIYVQVGGTGNGTGVDANNKAPSVTSALEQLATRWGLHSDQFRKGMFLRSTIVKVVCDGTTSFSENVQIHNIKGGAIVLEYASNSQITGTITFAGCDNPYVRGNRSSADSNDGARFYRTGSGDAISFIGCKTSTCIKARFYNTTKTGNAINCYWGGTLYVNSLDIYGFDVGIFMGDGGRIHSCNTSGHNMNYGFKADAGSIINAVFRIPNVNNSYNNGSIFLPDSNSFGTTKQNSYQAAPPAPTYTSQTNTFSGHSYKSVRPTYSSDGVFNQSHYNSQYGAWTGYVYFSGVNDWLSNSSGQSTAKVFLQRKNTAHGYPTGARPYLVGYGFLTGDSTGANGLAQGGSDWFTIPATIVNELKAGTRNYLSFTHDSAYHYILFETNAVLKVTANKPN